MTCSITETHIPSTGMMITALLAQLPPDSQTKDFRTIAPRLDPAILDIIRQEGPVFSAHIIAQ